MAQPRSGMARLAIIALLGGIGTAANAQPTQPPAASAIVAWDGKAAEVEFHASGNVALLIARGPEGTVPLLPVATVRDALRILADRRLSFAWPALLAWAGADLATLRDRALARTRLAYEVGLVSSLARTQTEEFSGSQALTATLQYAAALRDAGFRRQSLDLLRGRIAAINAGDSDDLAMQKVLLTVRLANNLMADGDDAAAVASLDGIVGDARIAAHWRLNAQVNLAQALAAGGRYQPALVTIEDAWKSFGAQQDANLKVPGSDANFARIKACALHGMGQGEKARALIADMVEGENDFTTTTSVRSARFLASVCMRDKVGAAAEAAALLRDAAPAGQIFAIMQPGSASRPDDRRVLEAMIAESSLRKPLAEIGRILPPQFDQAQQGWPGRAIDALPSPR